MLQFFLCCHARDLLVSSRQHTGNPIGRVDLSQARPRQRLAAAASGAGLYALMRVWSNRIRNLRSFDEYKSDLEDLSL
jgi:hypothetical protein